MTIEECYKELGGDYADVSGRLPSRAMVEKFAGRFPDDPSFDMLCRCIAGGDRAGAFRAAHSLKGVCANLGFSRLLDSVYQLTEVLRPQLSSVPEEAVGLLEAVRRDYDITVGAIRRYLQQ